MDANMAFREWNFGLGVNANQTSTRNSSPCRIPWMSRRHVHPIKIKKNDKKKTERIRKEERDKTVQ